MNYKNHSQVTQIAANPLARQRTSIFWMLGAALILGLLLAVSSSVSTASADQPAIVSVTLDDGTNPATTWLPNVPNDG